MSKRSDHCVADGSERRALAKRPASFLADYLAARIRKDVTLALHLGLARSVPLIFFSVQ